MTSLVIVKDAIDRSPIEVDDPVVFLCDPDPFRGGMPITVTETFGLKPFHYGLNGSTQLDKPAGSLPQEGGMALGVDVSHLFPRIDEDFVSKENRLAHLRIGDFGLFKV